MHAQEVYLHPYCLVVTRLDKIHIPAVGHTPPSRGVYTNNCVGGGACAWFFTTITGMAEGIFFTLNVCVCVCVSVDAYSGYEAAY